MSAFAERRPLVTFMRLPADPRIGWVPYAWLLYLITLFVAPLAIGPRSGGLITAALATLAFVPLYFRSYWAEESELRVLAAAVLAIGVVATPFNAGASVLFVYAGAMLARQRSVRVAAAGVAAATLVGAVTSWAFAMPSFHWVAALFLTPFIGAISIHAAQGEIADAKLRLAQGELERLAAVAERERIARDLHDVLGHSLTLIVRKAELAARLADRDVVAAQREMRELEAITRGALGEVRSAIAGYRATWGDEVARAVMLLGTSGVALEMGPAPQVGSRAVEEALALALREAVTNVARHAQASRCEVRWSAEGPWRVLSIADDGRGAASAADDASAPADGIGLSGLRRRIEAIGGRVERHAGLDGRGHALRIVLPAEAS